MKCPRCDQQGIIERYKIKRTGEEILVCDECDATWLTKTAVSRGSFHDFSTYMESLGLNGIAEEIERCVHGEEPMP